MTHIFTLGDMDDFSEKINLDELYEKKKQSDLAQLNIFNKILNRIHNRIKFISRQRKDQFCFFVVPEIMIGIPKYDVGECVAYLFDKLQTNGFVVNYTHPNMLFISWKKWIPDYVRDQIKKKTKMAIDGHGNIVTKKVEEEEPQHTDQLGFPIGKGAISVNKSKDNKNYKSIDAYKPSGNSIYSTDMFKNIKF
tara:strand:+ start:888 stop:1466 length:579 start_codon:yes stop_codon:yes gene_type:complete